MALARETPVFSRQLLEELGNLSERWVAQKMKMPVVSFRVMGSERLSDDEMGKEFVRALQRCVRGCYRMIPFGGLLRVLCEDPSLIRPIVSS